MSGFLDPTHVINTIRLVGMTAILFAECGLLVGFFLPGDSLLVTAGLLVTQGLVAPLWVLFLFLQLAVIAGNLLGWWIGRPAPQSSRTNCGLFLARRARSGILRATG
jgi:membrane-associated protein